MKSVKPYLHEKNRIFIVNSYKCAKYHRGLDIRNTLTPPNWL